MEAWGGFSIYIRTKEWSGGYYVGSGYLVEGDGVVLMVVGSGGGMTDDGDDDGGVGDKGELLHYVHS